MIHIPHESDNLARELFVDRGGIENIEIGNIACNHIISENCGNEKWRLDGIQMDFDIGYAQKHNLKIGGYGWRMYVKIHRERLLNATN